MGDNKDENGGLNQIPDSENGFSYVQEKIKSKTRKRLKKVLSVIGLALLAGIVFGLSARAAFLLSADPVAKVLGIETEKDIPTVSPTGSIRSEVSFPTNKLVKVPTTAPDKTPTDTVTDRPQNTPTPKEAPTAAPTDETAPSEIPVTEAVSLPPVQDTATPTVGISPELITTAAGQPDTAGGEETDNGTEKGEQGKDDQETSGREKDDQGTESENPLDGYLGMIARMREIAVKAQESLIRVYSVTTGVNWMDESIETKQELTGVLMGNNGVELLILADYNLVAGADRLEAMLPDGGIYDTELYSFDLESNMAVLSVELKELPDELPEYIKYMQLGDSHSLACGEPVIAIGRPNGYYGAMEFGYVSHTGIFGYILDGSMDEFMTDFSFSPEGDGVVIDVSGNLVGFIPASKDQDMNKYRIIGINSLKPLILKLLNGSEIPLFGIRSEDIPADILENMGIKNGIYINEVISSSPAGKAGIKKGDVIMQIDDEEIKSVSQFYEMLLNKDASAVLEVHVFRASRPENPYFEEKVILSNK
ncbi:MAG: PDZ domain-containing protein [Lachnospiraceae bacterium]|nr:PDZ domain-containing protein [Lachnospiraceae bacterium]